MVRIDPQQWEPEVLAEVLEYMKDEIEERPC